VKYEELMELVKKNKTWKRKQRFTSHDTSKPKGVEITDAKTGGQYVLTGYIWPEFTAEVRGEIGPLKKSAQRKVRVVIRRKPKVAARLSR
jgi:hypothetical protein